MLSNGAGVEQASLNVAQQLIRYLKWYHSPSYITLQKSSPVLLRMFKVLFVVLLKGELLCLTYWDVAWGQITLARDQQHGRGQSYWSESTLPFEKTSGFIKCVHEPSRHRCVLVFIKAREWTHSSAPGLAHVALWATCCFLHHFQRGCFFQRKIRTRLDCWVIGGGRPRLPMIPSHSSHLSEIPRRSVSYR